MGKLTSAKRKRRHFLRAKHAKACWEGMAYVQGVAKITVAPWGGICYTRCMESKRKGVFEAVEDHLRVLRSKHSGIAIKIRQTTDKLLKLRGEISALETE